MENLIELKDEELREVDGGIVWVLAYALVYASIGAAGGYIAGMAEAGYEEACN